MGKIMLFLLLEVRQGKVVEVGCYEEFAFSWVLNGVVDV
jgi:hypothetical protein